MFDRRRIRVILLLLIFLFVLGLIFVGYLCPDRLCALSSGPPTPPYLPETYNADKEESDPVAYSFSQSDLLKQYDFKPEGDRDVMVFLHIQKTGGTTFGKHLVKNIELENQCQCQEGRKRCDCLNGSGHYWLFSRYSTGWSCGLHADWTELKSCVTEALDKKEGHARVRQYYYITILRDPIHRYISEWKHMQRGSTWMSALLKCNGRQATLAEVPFCFSGEDWTGVSIEEFTSCASNLANNRQTRMLANLSLVHCYDNNAMSESTRNQLILKSAKENLLSLEFFGLTEFQEDTQYLFEHTFGLSFIQDFEQHNQTHANQAELSRHQLDMVMSKNSLDMELYEFAKDLFKKRVDAMRSKNLQSFKTIDVEVHE